MNGSPAWLDWLERKAPWLRAIGVPKIAILFVTLQVLGFFMVMSDSVWIVRLALLPAAVMQGEYWRLVTFLALPLSLSPIWVLLALWFLYSILNTLEAVWGDFRTTFYILISLVLTITYSLVFGYPVTDIRAFEMTLFLAAAALFPEQQILLLVFPVKMKWVAWFTAATLALEFVQGGWLDRGYLLAIFSNYLLFFGPAQISRIRQARRKREFQRKMGR